MDESEPASRVCSACDIMVQCPTVKPMPECAYWIQGLCNREKYVGTAGAEWWYYRLQGDSRKCITGFSMGFFELPGFPKSV